MPLRCKWNVHRWRTREATIRAGTFISRCPDCGALKIKHYRSGKPRVRTS